MIKKIKNISVGNKFFLGMATIYAIVAVFDYGYAALALTGTARSFLNLIPLFVLVYAVIFVINIFLSPEAVKKHLGADSGKKGWIYALLGSILVSGPPYVILPMLKDLKAHGMKYSLIAVFMNNRHVQPAMLPVMAYYFGVPFTVVISAYILIFALVNGWIVGKILDR